MRSDEEARRAANEVEFREANERIRAAERELEPPLERVPFLCECDDVRCRETIQLTSADYERIRDDPTQFAIVPGHDCDGEVVEERDGYTVVRKTGAGAMVAEAFDPRDERS